MRFTTAIVGARGRLTLPRDLRHGLQLQPGDKVQFAVQPDGTVFMTVLRSASDAVRHTFGSKAAAG